MPAAQITHGTKARRFKRGQILIRQPVQGIGTEQHPMAQCPAFMAEPAAQVAQIGSPLKRDEARELLEMPIHRAGLVKMTRFMAGLAAIWHGSSRFNKSWRFALAVFCAFEVPK